MVEDAPKRKPRQVRPKGEILDLDYMHSRTLEQWASAIQRDLELIAPLHPMKSYYAWPSLVMELGGELLKIGGATLAEGRLEAILEAKFPQPTPPVPGKPCIHSEIIDVGPGYPRDKTGIAYCNTCSDLLKLDMGAWVSR